MLPGRREGLVRGFIRAGGGMALEQANPGRLTFRSGVLKRRRKRAPHQGRGCAASGGWFYPPGASDQEAAFLAAYEKLNNDDPEAAVAILAKANDWPVQHIREALRGRYRLEGTRPGPRMAGQGLAAPNRITMLNGVGKSKLALMLAARLATSPHSLRSGPP